MNENYYLKIGGTEALSEQLIADLSSDDAATKANAVLSERLKKTRIRVGTLLKTDNVSFLVCAGASMKAGGIGLASMPVELERDLHTKVYGVRRLIKADVVVRRVIRFAQITWA